MILAANITKTKLKIDDAAQQQFLSSIGAPGQVLEVRVWWGLWGGDVETVSETLIVTQQPNDDSPSPSHPPTHLSIILTITFTGRPRRRLPPVRFGPHHRRLL